MITIENAERAVGFAINKTRELWENIQDPASEFISQIQNTILSMFLVDSFPAIESLQGRLKNNNDLNVEFIIEHQNGKKCSIFAFLLDCCSEPAVKEQYSEALSIRLAWVSPTNVIFINQLFKSPEFYHKSKGCVILRVMKLTGFEVVLEALQEQVQKIESPWWIREKRMKHTLRKLEC